MRNKQPRCGSKPRLLGMLAMTASYMAIELVVGNMTNSMALVADSFHMLSDVIALIIAYVSVKMSPKEWEKNTFGWARAEVVGALINAVFLVALCFSITVQAIKRFLVIEPIEDPQLILIVGGVGLLINVIGLVVFGDVGHGHSHGGGQEETGGGHGHSHGEGKDGHAHTLGKEAEAGKEVASGSQMNITGVFLHVLADALGSVAVLISASIIWLTDWQYRDYLDPVLSLVIVIIILASTWPLLRDSMMILMNTIPPHINLLDLETRLLAAVPGVASIHEFHVWQLVGRKIVASVHLQLTAQPNAQFPEQHMQVGRDVKKFLHGAGIHSSTVQCEYGGDRGAGCCVLGCPPDTSGQTAQGCIEASCCRDQAVVPSPTLD